MSSIECVYLWWVRDLTDPQAAFEPLASYLLVAQQGVRDFTWAPDLDRESMSPGVRAIVEAVPRMVELGVRYDARGMGAGTVQERGAFFRLGQPLACAPEGEEPFTGWVIRRLGPADTHVTVLHPSSDGVKRQSVPLAKAQPLLGRALPEEQGVMLLLQEIDRERMVKASPPRALPPRTPPLDDMGMLLDRKKDGPDRTSPEKTANVRRLLSQLVLELCVHDLLSLPTSVAHRSEAHRSTHEKNPMAPTEAGVVLPFPEKK